MSLTILAPFTALLLMLSVLPAYTSAAPPLAQGTDSGEEEEDQTQDPTTQDPQGQESEGDPNTDPQTENQQNQQIQGTGTASITINKYECLADYGGAKSLYSSYCFPPSSATEFRLLGPNFDQTYQGGFTQAGLEPGPGGFAIQETVPQGWYPIVYCQKATQQPADGGTQQVVIYEGRYEVEVLGGEYLVCDWYNIPPLPADLYITKHYCRQDFDAYAASLNDLSRECQESGPDAEFTISQNGAEVGTETATGTPQQAAFLQIQPGQTTIVETIPEGYGEPIVNCNISDSLGNDIGGDSAPVDNDRITWQVGSGHVVYCDWYNVYAEQYGTISVLKITCPEDFTPSSGGTFEYYEGECTEPTEGVSFKLDGESTGNPGSQETDQNGQVTWNEREPDTYYITEEPPEDEPWPWSRAVVYCSFYDPAALQEREWERYELDDEGRITFDFEENQNIACVWFNLYDDEYGSVTVYKYVCPDHIAYGEGSYEYYESECEAWTEGISFKLDGESTGNPGSQETDDDGRAVWNEREADTYYLSEELPEDEEDWPYGAPVIYCSYDVPPDDPEWEAYTLDNEGRIQFELEHQQDIVCYWFNLYEDEYGSVTVYKYTCPEHIGYGAGSYEYYAHECDEWTEGVSFKLDGESTGNPGSQTTDDDGMAYWDEREEDTYYLTEEEPEDGPWPYGQPAVYCYVYDPQSEPEWEQYETDDEGRVRFELEHQQDIVCVWFNLYEDAPPTSPSPSPSSSPRPSASPRPTGPGGYVPPAGNQSGGTPTGPATLIINKYDCEDGYDWIDEDADPEEDCVDQPDGVVYELALYDGPPNQQPRRAETGEDNPGEARFTGVNAGDYVLTELDIEEGTFAFILACDSSRRDFDDYPFYPFAVASDEGAVYLTVVAGETLECDWYNIAPDPDAEGDDAGRQTGQGGGTGGGNGQNGGNNQNDDEDDEEYGLMIEVYSCDGDERSVDACNPQTDPINYALHPVDGGDPVALETEGGSGGLDGLDGSYTLVQIGQQPCVIESADVDAQGNLDLSVGKRTLVRVFNCA